jgi:type IV pilus assembly protein PilB
MAPKDAEGKPFFRGKGCVACNNTGYKGRTAIHEFMIFNDEIRELVNRNASTGEMRKAGQRYGMLTLRDAGMQKIHEGISTIEEVARETALEM